jgi:hypothetical protein
LLDPYGRAAITPPEFRPSPQGQPVPEYRNYTEPTPGQTQYRPAFNPVPNFAQQGPTYAPRPPRRRKKSFIPFTIVAAFLAFALGAGIPLIGQYSGSVQQSITNAAPSSHVGTDGSIATVTDLSTTLAASEQILKGSDGVKSAADLKAKIATATKVVADSKSTPAELGKAQNELATVTADVRQEVRVVQVNTYSAAVKTKLANGEFHQGATRKDDVRNMLDTLGGQDIGVIYVDSPCGLTNAAGCVKSEDPSVMYISPKILNKAYYQDYMLLQTVAHEYGHTVHFRTGYYRVFNNPEVKAAFGKDPEHIADCMSQDITGVVFTTYGYTCDASQLAAARKIWNDDLAS